MGIGRENMVDGGCFCNFCNFVNLEMGMMVPGVDSMELGYKMVKKGG